MRRHTLRTAALRLSAFAVLLVSFACCAGPSETVEEASEAMSLIPPLNPSPRLTVVPRPTAEDLAQMEQFVRDNLPKWKVYANGHDYEYGDHGKRYFSHPQELDRHCALVLIPEGADRQPERWIFLRYERYWMQGPAYFTEELKLSPFDLLGLLLALEDAGPEPPQLWSRERLHGVDMLKYEDGPYGVLPPVPPDWGIDNHTWTGGPPGYGVRQPSSGTTPPGSNRQRNWPPPPPRHTGPPFESLNGVSPTDKPVGKYPGWDKPHPGEWPEKFRCGGKVYEGYKSDCPDYQRKPVGERWTKPLDEVAREVANNARHTNEFIRTDPNCMTACLIAVNIPTILSTACFAAASLSAIPNPYIKAWAILCRIFRFYKDPTFVAGAGASTALGPRWCENEFCAPPSGKAKLEKP